MEIFKNFNNKYPDDVSKKLIETIDKNILKLANDYVKIILSMLESDSKNLFEVVSAIDKSVKTTNKNIKTDFDYSIIYNEFELNKNLTSYLFGDVRVSNSETVLFPISVNVEISSPVFIK